MNKDIVYKATISTSNSNDTKHYVHRHDFKYILKSDTEIILNLSHRKKYSNETELSKHIWHLKQNKTDFTIKWSIIRKSVSYTGGCKRCNLCLEEKLNILKEKDNCLLNKRWEIIWPTNTKKDFKRKESMQILKNHLRYFVDWHAKASELISFYIIHKSAKRASNDLCEQMEMHWAWGD